MKKGPIVLVMAATILVWGFAFIPLKFLVSPEYTDHPLSPEAFLVLRFVPLLPLLLLLAARWGRRERRELLIRDWPWIAAMGLLVIPGYHLPLNLGLRTPIHTGLISLIVNLSPALTYLLATASGQERATGARTAGTALALIGLALIFGEELALSDKRSGTPVFSWEGAGWMVLCALSWTLYTLIGRRIAPDHDPQFLFAASGAIGTLAILLAAPLLFLRADLSEYLRLDRWDWGCWAYVSLLSSFFAYWAWIQALRRFEASRVSSSANLVPLLVRITAAIFLPAERRAFTPPYLLGALATMLGVFLVISPGQLAASFKSSDR